MNRVASSQDFALHAATLVVLVLVTIPIAGYAQSPGATPLRIGIVGLVHPHADGIWDILKRTDVKIVGVSESDPEVVATFANKGLDQHLLFTDEADMIEKTYPQAVIVYTTTYDHPRAVEIAARYHVHAMLEKPLAVSNEDAQAIAHAARSGNIQVIVNFSPTWYPNTTALFSLTREKSIGDVRKIVIHDGHSGPKPLDGALRWVINPKLNGGGALFDFGCYGADIVTWLMDGQRPTSVTAVTQTIKPDIYKSVDDEATVILAYPKAQAILQASWNWPFNRKDIEFYGERGYAITVRNNALRVRRPGQQEEEVIASSALTAPQDDSLHYLKAVVMDGMNPVGLSSLENNIIATEILDAARRSAQTGKRVDLAPQ